MTTYTPPHPVTCGVCRTQSKHVELLSTNAMGSPDLDLRPPDMERSTMHTWVNRCPGCGHCARDISEAGATISEIVRSEACQSCLNDETLPELCNSFRCRAMLDESAGQLGRAAQSMIRAAWVCDDAGNAEGARTCRVEAAELLHRAGENGQMVGGDPATNAALHADLRRRAGQFDRAREIVMGIRSTVDQELLAAILAYELRLIAAGDSGCYTVSDVLGSAESHD